jgi:hypothetical protein
MSLQAQLASLITAIGTQFKGVKSAITGSGTSLSLTGLTTTDKSSIVAAINEVQSEVGGGGATNLTRTLTGTTVTVNSDTGTDATIPSADGTNAGVLTSADKTKLDGIEALADVTDAGNVGSTIHGATAKTTPVGADEIAIMDSAASFVLKRMTATNFAAFIQNLIVDAAPGTMDTLNEIAAALGDDPNFAATMTTALAGKQPLDADLTAIAAVTSAADKVLYATGAGTWNLADFTSFGRTLVANANASDARDDLSVYSRTELGDPETDLVALFTAALA